MVSIKSSTDLAKMREAGQIAGRALKLAGESIKAGMTTKALDKIIPYKEGVIGCFAGISGAGLTANRKRYLQIFSDIFPLFMSLDNLFLSWFRLLYWLPRQKQNILRYASYD